MLVYLFILAISMAVIALLYARWEYRKRDKLTPVGLLLLCAMLFIPNLMLDYATNYEMPDTALDYVGVLIGLVGITLCLAGIMYFRSISKMLCINTGVLTITGPYRWGRNPQYVGWVLFLLGYALNDWSLWCLAALLVVAVSLHLLVLVEEKHLYRVFGQPYAEFCSKTPRYFGCAHPNPS